MWEEEFDCSIDYKIIYLKPSVMMSFGLTASKREGEYLNERGEVVCLDPSIYEKGPSSLLIKKEHLLKILKSAGFSLVWIIQGEKQMIGGGLSPILNFDHRLSGLYHMDKNGVIKGETKTYIRTYPVAKK